MSPQCLPPSLASIPHTILEQTCFEDFQDDHCGGHLGYWNGMILAILNRYVVPMPPTKFQLNPIYSLGVDVHLKIFKFLAILNLHVAPMPPTNFGLKFTKGSGADVVSIFKMVTQAAILESQTEWFKQFWISISLWCFPSSFGSIQLTVWEEISFEEFQDGNHGSCLGYWNGTILAILNVYVAPMPSIKFQLNPTYYPLLCLKTVFWLTKCVRGDVVWRISRWPSWWPSWISEWKNFSNSDLCVTVMLPIKFCSILLNEGLIGAVVWRISKWTPWQPSCISEWNDFSTSKSPCCHNASH